MTLNWLKTWHHFKSIHSFNNLTDWTWMNRSVSNHLSFSRTFRITLHISRLWDSTITSVSHSNEKKKVLVNLVWVSFDEKAPVTDTQLPGPRGWIETVADNTLPIVELWIHVLPVYVRLKFGVHNSCHSDGTVFITLYEALKCMNTVTMITEGTSFDFFE